MIVRVPTYLALAFVTWYMAREVGRRERLRGEYERRLHRVQELKDRFQLEAYTDQLTNLSSRAHFEARLREEVKRARDRSKELTLLFFDVDDFKSINDNLGHRTGDKSLKLIAKVLKLNVREVDTIGRYGGDEFTVLLTGTPLSAAQGFFTRIKEEVAEHSESELGFTLTLSAGAAIFPHDAANPEGLLQAADLAMYRAKHRGKNQFFHPSMEVT